LNWTPQLNLETALDWLVDWYRAWQSQAASEQHLLQHFSLQQISDYESLISERAKRVL